MSDIFRDPPRWVCGRDEETEETVALRVGLGDGVLRPPVSTCLKQMHNPFTLLQVVWIECMHTKEVYILHVYSHIHLLALSSLYTF